MLNTNDQLLTVNFSQSHSTLVESGDQLSVLEQMNNLNNVVHCNIFYLTKVQRNVPWEEVDESFKYKKYHSITINMDPSKLGYQNELSYQKNILYPIVHRFRHKIKYLTLIYEWGRGKLHWHMLINIQSSVEFKEALEAEFGKRRAVYIRKIEPNNNETLYDNLIRINEYFRKEEHNKIRCCLHINK